MTVLGSGFTTIAPSMEQLFTLMREWLTNLHGSAASILNLHRSLYQLLYCFVNPSTDSLPSFFCLPVNIWLDTHFRNLFRWLVVLAIFCCNENLHIARFLCVLELALARFLGGLCDFRWLILYVFIFVIIRFLSYIMIFFRFIACR